MLKGTLQHRKNRNTTYIPHWGDINPPSIDTGYNIQQTTNKGWHKE